RELRDGTRLAQAAAAAYARGHRVFLEIGPSATLPAAARQAVARGDGVWLEWVRKERPDWDQVLETLGELYARGVPIDWASFDRGHQRRKVVVPGYPFQRERYWIDSPALPGAQGVDETRRAAEDAWLHAIEWRERNHVE